MTAGDRGIARTGWRIRPAGLPHPRPKPKELAIPLPTPTAPDRPATAEPAPGRSLQSLRGWLAWGVFVGLHVGCLLVFAVPATGAALGLFAALYVTRSLVLAGGFHRYFSHRAFKTSRWFQFALGWVGTTAVQGSPLWWASNHRLHHRHSDTAADPHSPVARSAWWAHIGWVLSQEHRGVDWDRVRDLARYPELRWLERWEAVPPVLLAGLCYLAGGWPGVVWGFVASTVLAYHATFSVNVVCHLFGTRRYATPDHSRNNLVMAVAAFGEGWHNNHHHYPSAARAGFRWWEVDATYYALRALSWVGLVWDLRQPTPRALAANLAAGHAARQQTSPRNAS